MASDASRQRRWRPPAIPLELLAAFDGNIKQPVLRFEYVTCFDPLPESSCRILAGNQHLKLYFRSDGLPAKIGLKQLDPLRIDRATLQKWLYKCYLKFTAFVGLSFFVPWFEIASPNFVASTCVAAPPQLPRKSNSVAIRFVKSDRLAERVVFELRIVCPKGTYLLPRCNPRLEPSYFEKRKGPVGRSDHIGQLQFLSKHCRIGLNGRHRLANSSWVFCIANFRGALSNRFHLQPASWSSGVWQFGGLALLLILFPLPQPILKLFQRKLFRGRFILLGICQWTPKGIPNKTKETQLPPQAYLNLGNFGSLAFCSPASDLLAGNPFN